MNIFSMTRRCISKLEKYVFDRVWNEPYSEYRTNTRPRILNRIVEVSSGSSDNYGNDISTTQYVSAAGVLTGEFEQINLPSSDQYYVYSVELNQFRSIKLNALEWITLAEYCNESVVDIQMYSDSGVFLWRGGIYIKQAPQGDHVLVAVDATMFHKCLDVVNPDGSIATLADPSAVFFTKYIDSDGVADNGIGTKFLDLDAINRIKIYREDPVPNTATVAYYNGRMLLGSYLSSLKLNGYIEYVVDLDIIADIQIDMRKSPPVYTNNNGQQRLLIHVPRNSNKKNRLITYNTCDIYIIPNTITDDVIERGFTPATSGVLFHMCDREKNYHQLTHNDFSIDKDLLDQTAIEAGSVAGDYTVRVLVRTHEKKLGLVRDANYCDLLYSVSHSDDDIIKFLINDKSKQQYNMEFWTAAHLEANSAYAAAMLSRVGSTVKPEDAKSYYRPPIEKKFIAGKKYYTLDVTGEWVEAPSSTGSDIPEGVMELRLETGAVSNFTAIQINTSEGSKVTDGALESKQHTGVTITNPNQCLYCGLKRECAVDGVINEASSPIINSYRCPKFSHRKMLDYIKIFGYYHTLAIICKRVTTYEVTSDIHGPVVSIDPEGNLVYDDAQQIVPIRIPTALAELKYSEFYLIVYVNGIKIKDSDVEIVGETYESKVKGLTERFYTSSPYLKIDGKWIIDNPEFTFFEYDRKMLKVCLKNHPLKKGDFVTVEIIPNPSDEDELAVETASETFDVVDYKGENDGLFGTPVEYAFEPIGSNLKNSVTKKNSEILFLNGKILVGGIDYIPFAFYTGEFSPNVQNISYINEKNNSLEVITTTDKLVSASGAKGFIIGNKVTWDGIAPFWFDGLSVLSVGGKVCHDFTWDYRTLTISDREKHENGEPFMVRTQVPISVINVMNADVGTEAESEADLLKMDRIREYFGKAVPERPYLVLIPNSHKVYSTYLMAMVKDIIYGNLEFVPYRDKETFLNQETLSKYNELKSTDVLYQSITSNDLRFLDIYPAYHNIVVGTRRIKQLVDHLVKMVTPSDDIRHREHVNGN